MPNTKHLKILNQGVEIWNRWRYTNPEIQPDLQDANLYNAKLAGANFTGADLRGTDFRSANLNKALLAGADLRGAHLREAELRGADLHEADLQNANVVGAILTGGADLTGCKIYGLSAWEVYKDEATKQEGLLITAPGEPEVTVDDLEVAQFTYLLIRNEKIRDVINTIGKKAVLILGRFTERKHILEEIRTAVRDRKYLPIVFDFKRPTDRDFTETVMTLAGMSRFIIADITHPKSVPLELQSIVPNYKIPFVTIIEEGERPFAMFRDLWIKHKDSVLPPLEYNSIEALLQVFDEAVIDEANRRLKILRDKKAKEMTMRHVKDYDKR